MKRIMSTLLALSLLFTLSACNLDNPDVGTRNVNDPEILDFNEPENDRARVNDRTRDVRDHPLQNDPEYNDLDNRVIDQDADDRFIDDEDILNRNNR